ncbi:alginate O-acetyltransferase complex protein AlgJ [Xylophilus ampelinus]|uniref:Alginate O-acetyltransferase complex protein AlgJ n=2 Tax=Xylophilus ampelinus TaxID=54067 RepID=A0A318SU73_9BURK|nr:alginate O-acetyltransferase complex protein AlgJ [Xylophilus ampelinus]
MRGISSALALAPQARVAAKAERIASWIVLGDLGPQVRQGCRGWLFLAEEFAVRSGAEEAVRQRVALAMRLRKALDLQGIRLVMVLVPDKSRIEAQHLCHISRPARLEQRTDTWANRMREAGIPLVDLTPLLHERARRGIQTFYRTDTHWNEEGASVSAAAVADAVQATGGPPMPRRCFEIARTAARPRLGDLVRLAGIEELPARLLPAAEVVSSSSSAPCADAKGGMSSADDLFGDSDLPTVALVGTSFSTNSNFVGFLSRSLGTSVPSFALDGGNFSGSIDAYLQSTTFKESPPRLLIWEIPERTLDLPLTPRP